MELQSLLKVTMLVNQLSKSHSAARVYTYRADSYAKHKYSIAIFTDSVFFSIDCVALFALFEERGLSAFIGSINDHPVIYVQ